MVSMDFVDRVAIVTGGASGMGAATIRRLAGDGARVVIVDRNGQLAHAVAEEVGGTAMVGDVSDSAFCDVAVAQAISVHGRLDVLVNAAGVIVRAAAKTPPTTNGPRSWASTSAAPSSCAGPPFE